MDIQRNDYVERLYAKSWNGKVKIITGIRRCGKSYLLSHLYKQFLINKGVAEDCFVEIDLEEKSNAAYRNPNVLSDFVMEQCKDRKRKYYVFIDEIQRCSKVLAPNVDLSRVAESGGTSCFYDLDLFFS